jgi:glutaredoxin
LTLTLFTRPGCHLCERLESLLAPMLQSRRIGIKLHDITDDDAANDLYWSRIPVLTRDGVIILEGRPSEAEIAAAMRALVAGDSDAT